MRNKTAAVVTARAWLEKARRALIHEADASLETHLLLAHVLDKPRHWLLAHPEAAIDVEVLERLDALLERRAAGEPLPYLLGRWEFYGLDFLVTPDVLIPRPETETLVEMAIEWLKERPGCQAADVGTGSGCIAVTLAKHVPGTLLLAVDRSLPALRIARQNARLHNVENMHFWQGDLLTALGERIDLLCANLPYIPRDTLRSLPVARHEPATALDGGSDGLRLIESLLADALRWMNPGGRLLLEMQFDQGKAITVLAKALLPNACVCVQADLAGLPRIVDIQLAEGRE